MDVFVSYKREDKRTASAIAEFLRGIGVSAWFDESLTSGEVYTDQIDRELVKAGAVLVCWSEAAGASEFVIAEAQKGRNLKKLAAISLEPSFDLNTLPVPLNNVQALHIDPAAPLAEQSNWYPVVERLTNLLGRPHLYVLARLKADVDARRNLASAASGLETWLANHPDDPARGVVDSLLQRLGPERAQLREDERRLAEREARERTAQFEAERQRLRAQLEAEERAEREQAEAERQRIAYEAGAAQRAAKQARDRARAQAAAGRNALIFTVVVLALIAGGAYGAWNWFSTSQDGPIASARQRIAAEADLTTAPIRDLGQAEKALSISVTQLCGGYMQENVRAAFPEKDALLQSFHCDKIRPVLDEARQHWLKVLRATWSTCASSFRFESITPDGVPDFCPIAGVTATDRNVPSDMIACGVFPAAHYEGLQGYLRQYPGCYAGGGMRLRSNAFARATEIVAVFDPDQPVSQSAYDRLAGILGRLSPLSASDIRTVAERGWTLRQGVVDALPPSGSDGREVQGRNPAWTCTLGASQDSAERPKVIGVYCQLPE
jgi:hypothetical protein